MEQQRWEQVVAQGCAVPEDRQLGDLTAELTVMLGSTDPHVRDGLATEVLATWVSEGVYDELLGGLGDGMCAGLRVGLGEDPTDSVFRRSFSALVLAECLARDTERQLVGHDTVLRWGDAVFGWLVREQDLRGFVPGSGWAHAVAHGADALGTLATNPALAETELVAVLDVVADRVAAPTTYRWLQREDDRLARAVMAVLRRDLVDAELVEGWLDRLVETSARTGTAGELGAPAANAHALLRALHLQLVLAADPPPTRNDLLLSVIDALARANRPFLS